MSRFGDDTLGSVIDCRTGAPTPFRVTLLLLLAATVGTHCVTLCVCVWYSLSSVQRRVVLILALLLSGETTTTESEMLFK